MTLNLQRVPYREPACSDLSERQLRRYHLPFRQAVGALAMRHERIADLLLSFPALLFALAAPRRGLDCERALRCVIEGRSLAEAAEAADVPMWLRKLPPEAFSRPLGRLPNGEVFRRQIMNHLPSSPRRAAMWLETVTDVAEFAHEAAAVWIARELVRGPRRAREPNWVKSGKLNFLSLWAWFSTEPETFGYGSIDRRWTPDIQIEAALEAAGAWHSKVGLHINLGMQPIADVWLSAGSVDGYDFVALNSIPAIVDEAAWMKNCLLTYGRSLAVNRSRLWSVRRGGERIATLQLGSDKRGDPLLNIVQLRGMRNEAVHRDVWWAARRWLHSHDLLQVEQGKRSWSAELLDRGAWQMFWRPYWLAKRRIPQWLPLAPSRSVFEALRAG